MRKNKYLLLCVLLFVASLVIAFVINILFKIKSDGIFSAEWSAGDALSYVSSIIGAVCTFVLGWVAYKQNEKLQKLEDNNYIASNSCMVLIDEVKIKPKADMPIDYDIHAEQILRECKNTDKLLTGNNMEIRLKKAESSVQATPSLVYVSRCTLLVGDNEKNSLESSIWSENIRDGYTRIAIMESEFAFNCKLLVTRKNQEKFQSAIMAENNSLTAEMEFMIMTDKYVVTKCKCRAYCQFQNNDGVVTWKSEKPMVFFYGHELKNRDEILVLGEEINGKDENADT